MTNNDDDFCIDHVAFYAEPTLKYEFRLKVDVAGSVSIDGIKIGSNLANRSSNLRGLTKNGKYDVGSGSLRDPMWQKPMLTTGIPIGATGLEINFAVAFWLDIKGELAGSGR